MPLRDPRPILAEEPTHTRYWVIVFAVALAVVTYIDRAAIGRATPSIMHDLGLNTKQMGWAFGAFGWAYALFEIPGGFLGDRMGPRRVLIRIVLWWSVFTAATGWTWNILSLTVTRFLFGVGEAGCFPNLTKAFTTWLPHKERVRAQGILWLSARWGGALTPLLAGSVMRQIGWRHAFEIFGCLGILWVIPFYFWYRDNPLENRKLNAAEREIVRDSARLASDHSNVPWGTFLRSRQVWMLCWQYFCLSYGWYFYLTWLPTYLQQGRHLTLVSADLLNTVPLLCGGLGNPAAVIATGYLMRLTHDVGKTRRILAYIGFAGASGFLVFSTTISNPVWAVGAIGAASFFNDLVMPGAWGAAMDVGGKHAGTLSGAMNMWGNVGGAIGPMAIGYILSWSDQNWNLTFYVSAAIYLMGIVFWRFLDPVTPLEKPGEVLVMA